MKLLVDRFKSNGETTLGKLYINGIFECYTLEDEFRTVKVWGKTRIPAGTYDVKLRTEGSFHNRYLKRFPNFHIGMLHLQNVPNFKYVLIHIGNTDDDTAGCLLVGGRKISGWTLVNSTIAYKKLYPKIIAALQNNEKVTIEYQDNDIKVRKSKEWKTPDS